jgi:hypothetical protein
VSYGGCSRGVRVGGWWLPSWGHLPPRAQGNALFLAAVRRILGRS